MTTKTPTKIVKGTRFFAQWADSNAEWEVLTARGRACECVILSEEGYNTKRFFAKEEIVRILEWAAFNQKIHDASGAFFKGLKEGQIVHYNNGFNNFVRCRVVEHEGRNQFLPIALVGEWKTWDLQPSGYHARCIREGEIWTPHASTVYEAPQYAYKDRTLDPTKLEPLKVG